jgi:hypothetical protein
MGFCLYNNVAIGAAHARAQGAGKVAIIDYDVHHGNGTQHIFDADPRVLYISAHQHPYYPGTGAADEIGRGPGEGFTINLPLEVGAVDEDYRAVFDEVLLPVVRSIGAGPDHDFGRVRCARARSAGEGLGQHEGLRGRDRSVPSEVLHGQRRICLGRRPTKRPQTNQSD